VIRRIHPHHHPMPCRCCSRYRAMFMKGLSILLPHCWKRLRGLCRRLSNVRFTYWIILCSEAAGMVFSATLLLMLCYVGRRRLGLVLALPLLTLLCCGRSVQSSIAGEE
jgi:hypothetical protein